MRRSSATADYGTPYVKIADNLDRVVVVPDDGPAWRLKAALEGALPGLVAGVSAEGVDLLPRDAGRLLELRPEFRLRWSPDAERAAHNRAMAAARHPRLRRTLEVLASSPVSVAAARLDGLSDREVLDDHQIRNVAALTDPDCFGVCLFDEQGAGKTVSAIYAFDLLVHRDELDVALIVAPKSMVTEWVADFHRFTGGLYVARILSGSRSEKLAALQAGADVFVTNFETAVSLEKELRSVLRSADGRALLVADESFFVKNLDARRTRALKRLREWAGRAFVLCGTPAPNAPHDLVEQVTLADFGMTFGGIMLPEDRAAALPVVRDALGARGAFLRSLKQDVLPDLPSRELRVVRVPFAPAQRRAYEAALASLVVDLRQTDDTGFRRQLTSFMARRSALLQICSNPIALVPGYREIPAKVRALDRLLDRWVGRQNEKVVIWSFYTASLSALAERYARYGVVRYDGSTSLADRRTAVREFQEGDSVRLFVANPAAAGAGLTLHTARLAVYESLSNQAAHYLQSLDRIHRRGQAREVEYTVLLCEDSIEEIDFARLEAKQRAAGDLLGDPEDRSITRDAMLEELLEVAGRLGVEVGTGQA